MTFSMKRALAIFQKDYKDLSRNLFVSSTLIMPLFFAVFYSQLGGEGIDVTYFVINVTFSLVATFVQCALIAEEKRRTRCEDSCCLQRVRSTSCSGRARSRS
ncbi:hypothetical protein [Exiguobacterium mexicanum]|uniref:hypothetical protein n=1 Tax=Exiguobacterium mexicanum TaxID=340146 RepID=UPI0037BEECE0